MAIAAQFELPATADMHVHLRQDAAMHAAVVPTVRAGGADTAYVMPNLVPPLTAVDAVLAYRAQLQAAEPNVHFVMTLYLHETTTPATIAAAAATNGAIGGVKAYPAGATTNSAAGVVDWRVFWPVFGAMQDADLVLNLHGEVPPGAGGAGEQEATALDAEERFLPTLREIHAAFPRLRIVLEHCSSAAALEVVASCGPTVACSLTAHHLWLTSDAWASGAPGAAHNWCRPAAKSEADRIALLRAVVRGGPRVFFGSDSAPHPAVAKQAPSPAAGCFTQGWTTQLVLGALDDAAGRGWIEPGEVTQERLADFFSGNARRFYGLPEASGSVVLERGAARIPAVISGEADGKRVEVVPFRAGKETWSLRWK